MINAEPKVQNWVSKIGIDNDLKKELNDLKSLPSLSDLPKRNFEPDFAVKYPGDALSQKDDL